MPQPSAREPAPAPARAHSPLSRRPVAPRSPASSTASSTACSAAPSCMARLGCAFRRRGAKAVEREDRQRRAPQLQRRAAAASPEDRRTRRPEEAGRARSQSVTPPPSGTSLRRGQPRRLARPLQGLLQRARRQTPRPSEGSEQRRGASSPPQFELPMEMLRLPRERGRGNPRLASPKSDEDRTVAENTTASCPHSSGAQPVSQRPRLRSWERQTLRPARAR